jgi:hypothetical protein
MDARETSPTTVSRLDGAMALLDAQSRQVMELWLGGAGPEEIAKTVGLSERDVMVIRGSSLWKVRDLIAQRQTPEDTDVTIKTAQ